MKPILSPRESRCVRALNQRPHMREELDRAIGASNTPDIIFRLRNKGLDITCELVKRKDRDGNNCYPGRYSLTPEGRATAREWGVL